MFPLNRFKGYGQRSHEFFIYLVDGRKVWQRVLAVLLSIFFASCATPPTPLPLIADGNAKSFVPNANAATVYVFDHHAPISQFNIPVLIDTQIVGHVGKDRYIVVELPPGAHVFSSVGGQQNPEFNLLAESGKLYFLKQSQLWGAGHLGGARYDQISTAEGKSEIQKRQRVGARFTR